MRILIVLIVLFTTNAHAQVFYDRVKQVGAAQFVSVQSGDRYLVICGKKYDGEIDISYEFDARRAKDSSILRSIRFTIRDETCFGGVYPKESDTPYRYNTKTEKRELGDRDKR